jgi:hypothetical protein
MNITGSQSLQIVYVLINPAMPGLVKIGKTTQEEVDLRMKQLFSTGVPVPFQCVFACRVPDASVVERALHHAFGQTRINPTREFFRIEPERVVSILQLLHVEEVTEQLERSIESDATQADLQAAQATVLSPRLVQFNGDECSLTMATRKVQGKPEDYPLQPAPYWTYNGRTLKEIYDDVHVVDEEA